MSCLRYSCLLTHSGVQHIVLCFWFVFLRLVYLMIVHLRLPLWYSLAFIHRYRHLSIICKNQFFVSFSGIDELTNVAYFGLSCLGPLVFLVPKTFIYQDSNLLILSVPDEGYFRNPVCTRLDIYVLLNIKYIFRKKTSYKGKY